MTPILVTEFTHISNFVPFTGAYIFALYVILYDITCTIDCFNFSDRTIHNLQTICLYIPSLLQDTFILFLQIFI